MVFNLLLPVRGVQAVLCIICLGLSADIVHGLRDISGYNGFTGGYYEVSISISQFNYAVFCSVWTILALLYLIPAAIGRPLPASFTPSVAVLAVDLVTNIFWFACWIAIAAFLGNLQCSVTYGCGELIALAVFAAFEWIAFMVSSVLILLQFLKARKSGGTVKTSPNGGTTAVANDGV